eukprot:5309265-Pyramimonas_sp.AAC.1
MPVRVASLGAGHLGALLELSWAILGASLGCLGALFPPLCRLGTFPGASWAVFDAVKTNNMNALKMHASPVDFDRSCFEWPTR